MTTLFRWHERQSKRDCKSTCHARALTCVRFARKRNTVRSVTQGFPLKAATGGLPPPVGPLTAVCVDFIDENKSDIIKKKKKKYSNDGHGNF